MDKRYEVLDGLPAYGEMAIPITYNDELFVSEGYVVKFYKDDGTEWTANFQLGWTEISLAISSVKNNIIIVVAGGTGYLMNPNDEKPIKIFDYGISEIILRDNGHLILSNETDIIILDENGKLEWKSGRIADDGIKDLKLDGNILIGYGYDIGRYDEYNEAATWIQFVIDLDTKEIDWELPSSCKITENKPWWKFW